MKNFPTLFTNKTFLTTMALLSMSLYFARSLKAQIIATDSSGSHEGFYFYFWKEPGGTGTASMTLGADGNYTTEWKQIGNFIAGKGWEKGLADRTIHFSGSFAGGNNATLAVYGWTRNPLVEYYIVENHGIWIPPGGTSLGTFTSDGGRYQIYMVQRNAHPSIDGINSFKQFWSVRSTKRLSGTVTFANHVAAWKEEGLEMGTTYAYQIMATEGYMSNGSSNITISDDGPLTDLASGLQLEETSAIYTYLNPETNQLSIRLPEAPSPTEVHLYTITGVHVLASKTEKHELKMDMSSQDAGLYLLKIVTKGQTTTKKIIKP